jgi:hypothetical protein
MQYFRGTLRQGVTGLGYHFNAINQLDVLELFLPFPRRSGAEGTVH